MSASSRGFSRRHFVKIGGMSAIGLTCGAAYEQYKERDICLINPSDDHISNSAPVKWAASELERSLSAKGIKVQKPVDLAGADPKNICILISGRRDVITNKILSDAKKILPGVPEELGIIPGRYNGKDVLLVCGSETRGLVYALLELNDRLNYSDGTPSSWLSSGPVIEKPANKVRGINRLFVSKVEDRPWYNDRDMWPAYLTHLATQRFNRFSLSLGIGYDFLSNVTDSYLLFAYPFLLDVPGYKVRATSLPDDERDSNLAMLKYISQQTVARGMEFQLGLWMHGYELITSPSANHFIEGLTPENHGPYCRDAVRELLKACPDISGVTFRIHGESGVTEGSYEFWRMVFEGVASCGRPVRLDLHAKGIDQKMIDTALSTGLKVSVSPKYWAEHLGLPYHQADIRALEIPKPGKQTSGLMNLSSGSRSFIRYGYGDLLREDRQYEVLHRIWPGTQRILVWGDPVFCRAYSKAFSFCGSVGADLMEPLSFKGRQGSGIEGDRCGYSDVSLRSRWDWQKYLYSLRVFGRLFYNPDTNPGVWERYLNKSFGSAAKNMGEALQSASRILPLVLTAHGPSAANNAYWPEMYTNQSIVEPGNRQPYGDTPEPKVFGNVSPFDPQMFSGINEFADELLEGKQQTKYSPIEVAQWLTDRTENTLKNLDLAIKIASDRSSSEFRRFENDINIQAGLGNFFAYKFRAGVLYEIWLKTGFKPALEKAILFYIVARDAWSKIATITTKIYVTDLSVGTSKNLRGHWSDRLKAIEDDIALMKGKLETSTGEIQADERIQKAISVATGKPEFINAPFKHVPPQKFIPDKELTLDLAITEQAKSVTLFYRHVSQAERYRNMIMKFTGKTYTATIPSDYTGSVYPLQYYFVVVTNSGKTAMSPGLSGNLTGTPYYVVHPGKNI